MGYPLTWQRFINRNRLAEGGYGTVMTGVNTRMHEELTADRFNEDVVIADVLRDSLHYVSDEIVKMNSRWSMLLGDLRRLEYDAVDEQSICLSIAQRTRLDPEIVATVLKEFFLT